MKTPRGAVAVFVKTPSLSPVKTRLAKSIGEAAALSVYRHSLTAMRAVMTTIQKESGGAVQPFWAVAEAQGVHRREWRDFPAMHTGEGNLGERLHNIYSSLQRERGRVALLGSDCPQIPPQQILSALAAARGRAIITPSTDGGFCLFAAARRLPASMWKTTPYSRPDTLAQLLEGMPVPSRLLPPLTDIDNLTTLRRAIVELRAAPLPAQRRLSGLFASLLNNKTHEKTT